MKKLLYFTLLNSILSAQEWFITNFEYGKMLYHNPRGISCAKCHGENGEGKIIAKYYTIKNGKKIKEILKSPNIQNISYETLKSRLLLLEKKYKKLSVMPRYNYLTKNEIEAIYLYLQAQKDKK